MDFSLTDEQVMLRNMAREFAERYIEPTAKEDDQKEHFPWETIKQMGPLGLLGPIVPQEYGGLGLDYISYAIVTEEIARASLSIAMSVFGTHTVIEEVLLMWGSEEQRQEYLPAMCKGEIFGCCAVNESGAGINGSDITSKADPSESGWKLNGKKIFVINGGVSNLALTFAKATDSEGHQGIGAFFVNRDIVGFSSTDILARNGLRAANIAALHFQDCRIPRENLVGSINDGSEIFTTLDAIHFSVAASCLGATQACIDASIKYAGERWAFGQPISNFDMIQEMIADMIIGNEAARLLTYQVGDLKNRRLPYRKQLSIARCLSSDVAMRAATNAIQVHGAYGFGKEFPVERYFRDVTEVNLYGGSPLTHKLAAARSTFGMSSTG
jgi:alkylation response protein AidB-like acyl-CoA dehydrogenase